MVFNDNKKNQLDGQHYQQHSSRDAAMLAKSSNCPGPVQETNVAGRSLSSSHEDGVVDSRSSKNDSAYQRLYDRSLAKQLAGKEKREQIEKKLIPSSPKEYAKISPKDAQSLFKRLYDHAWNRKAADAADQKKKEEGYDYGDVTKIFGIDSTSRMITKRDADDLFNRLYKEKLKKDNITGHSSQNRTQNKSQSAIGTIDEKTARELFNRLYLEKMNKMRGGSS